MSRTLKERKYHSLEEVLNAADKKNWNDLRMDEIEDTEENRQIVGRYFLVRYRVREINVHERFTARTYGMVCRSYRIVESAKGR